MKHLSSLPCRRTHQGQRSRPGCQKLFGRCAVRLQSASEVFSACSSPAPSCSSLCLFPLAPSGGRRSSFYCSLIFFTNINHKKALFRTQRISTAFLHILEASAHFSKHICRFFLLAVLLLHPFFAVLLYSVSKEKSYNRDTHLIRPEEFSHLCHTAEGKRI